MSPAEQPADKRGTAIPPDVYDLSFGWDPRPEIERLLFCCGEQGLSPASALELGCGTGRLLAALRSRVPDLTGLDLSAAMIEYARSRTAAGLHVADMSDFSLGRTFDLIYASANTLRCVTSAAAVARMWRCIARHLSPVGVFIADLELGLADQAAQLGQSVTWTVARGESEARVTWTVIEPPAQTTHCCRVGWTFDVRAGASRRAWDEQFPLRTYDADEFLRCASAARLAPGALYLLRDPYLFEVPCDKAEGRCLVVLRRM